MGAPGSGIKGHRSGEYRVCANLECKKEFYLPRYRIDSGGRKGMFCSSKCSGVILNKERKNGRDKFSE